MYYIADTGCGDDGSVCVFEIRFCGTKGADEYLPVQQHVPDRTASDSTVLYHAKASAPVYTGIADPFLYHLYDSILCMASDRIYQRSAGFAGGSSDGGWM